MELLERDGALATLFAARDAAARGQGRVVLVSGEPGIGKTSLVTRFLCDLDARTRVLLGSCDDLSIPRPLGPFRDLAGSVSPALAEALGAGAAPHEIQGLLVSELERPPRPTVLVLEDVHWADGATIDSIIVLGRRIASLPALLVLTFRGGELPPGHPLHAAIGAVRAQDSAIVELSPLSEEAVASLAGEDADAVYAATAGNPFYVQELIAARAADVLPPSVANAVVGRASRLDDDARLLIQLVSVVPGRVRASLLDAVMPDWAAAADAPERRGLLAVDATHVRFRHELARNAIASSIPAATRRGLHAEILGALLAAGADPADIVHHAEAAGAEDVVAAHALLAARRAAALESNREAFSHYLRAQDFLDPLPPAEQALVLEELAQSGYLVDRLGPALAAIGRATAIHEAVGDREAVGRCTQMRSRLLWFAGDGELAREAGRASIAILEPLGESVELARAYGGFSQLAMLADDFEPALLWGERALALAARLGDEPTRAHALINVGTLRLQRSPGDRSALLEAFAIADAAGDAHEATRAIANLAYMMICWVVPEVAAVETQRALDYAEEHEVHNLGSYLASMRAWLELRGGDWSSAEVALQREIDRDISVSQLLAKLVLAELAVRRGDDDAAERLADVRAQADRTDELQRIVPVFELELEWALTRGEPLPVKRVEQQVERMRADGRLGGWSGMRVAAWAAVVGVELAATGVGSAPHTAMLQGDWCAAADAFGEVGWRYDRALMLSLLDDEAALVEALEIARVLGAGPLTRRVAGRLRELGLRVPSGPREAARDNPAGLTARQLQVLDLLVEGLPNTEIAERLVVSPRTAEHHVAAVLTKLGAATRREAVQRAHELAR